MSINMNEEESEVAEGFTRVLRAASMSAMQLKEAAEKRRQQAEKMSETERAQQAQKEQARTAVDSRVADSVHKSVQSPMFWNHASNERIAERMTVAQQLAGEHSKADSAFMLGSDVLRDKYGIDAVSIMHGQGSPMERQNELLEALDHHNAAGRLRAESRDADQTAETASEHVEAEAEVEAKYSEHALTAAAGEAKDADLPVEQYLDSLTETQRETLFDEHDRGIEDSQERDDRIETAQQASTEPVAVEAEAQEPAARHETRADAAQEDAASETQAETTSLSNAARTADVQSSREAHLATVGVTDRQAARARAQSLKNVPGSGAEYKSTSLSSKATPRKAASSGQAPGREHVHQR
ncbi:hypothetical protein [Brevibacterium linens]|uniref:hypothetical protein n=1 Tax=Brevibacterium linens TaxID=1703 RepID=UPI003F89F8AE